MPFCSAKYDVFESFLGGKYVLKMPKYGKIFDSEIQKSRGYISGKQTVLNLLLHKYFFSRVVLSGMEIPMFDSKNPQNLGTSNFIHGMLVARKTSQSSFPTTAALDFFGFVAKQSSSCAWVTFLFRFN